MKAFVRVLLLILIVASHVSESVTMSGKVYDASLDEIKNAIIVINTTPVQRLVAKGSYSLELDEGVYEIKAYGPAGVDEEIVSVSGGDNFTFDLILLPEEIPSYPDIAMVDFNDSHLTEIAFALAAAVGAAIAIVLFLKRKKSLPEELKQIVQALRAEGKRMTQKELRKRLGISESRMSLMLADLESRGWIKKIKRGRGNIIILQ